MRLSFLDPGRRRSISIHSLKRRRSSRIPFLTTDDNANILALWTRKWRSKAVNPLICRCCSMNLISESVSTAAMDATVAQNTKKPRVRTENAVGPNRARDARNGLVATMIASSQRRLRKLIART
jgi:hypothetical protein